MKLWEKIPLKKRILFLPVVVTVAVVAGAWYSVVPRTKDVIGEISELKGMTVKLSRMREKFSKLEALEGEDLNNSLQVVSLALPDNKNVARDIVVIRKTASGSGLVVSGLSVNPGSVDELEATESASNPKTGGQNNTVEYKLRVLGSKDQVGGFLLAMSKKLPLMLISEVGYVENEGSVAGDMIIKSFFVRSLIQPVAGDTPLSGLSSDENAMLEKISSIPQEGQIVAEEGGEDAVKSGKENPFSR